MWGGEGAVSLRAMFLLAQGHSGVYQLLLILHILAVVVAFSPAVVHSLTGSRLMREDEAAGRRFFGVAAANDRRVYLPALLVVGVLGFALVGLSDGAFEFSEPWISAAALLWVIIAGIVGAVIVPGERALAEGDRPAEKKVGAAGGIVTVLFIVVLILMVVKPG